MYVCDVCEGNKEMYIHKCKNCYGKGVVDWIRNAIPKVDNNYILIWACINGNLDKVKLLIKQGANIHAYDDSALRFAAYNGHLEIVKYLVVQGADVHVYDDYALRYAAYNGHLEVVKYLVEQGANIHANNDSVLKWATATRYSKVIDYLNQIIEREKEDGIQM